MEKIEYFPRKKLFEDVQELVASFYSTGDCLTKIVLVDAKNRTWTFANDMQKIKSEIVQQIYIQDNFEDIFGEEYHSMLVAHNIEEYQSRKYNHKDHPKYEIDVISLDFSEHNVFFHGCSPIVCR